MRSLFVSVDGPKGVGKTTLLDAVEKVFQSDIEVGRWIEKDLDPGRGETLRMLSAQRQQFSVAREESIVASLANGRATISQQINSWLSGTPRLLLIDRWYPSDAAFRRGVPFERCLAENLRRRVRQPDLAIALLCAAKVSWARASVRTRGLDSSVIADEQEHAASTSSFDAAARAQGWFEVRNEGSFEASVRQASDRIWTLLDAPGMASSTPSGER